MRATILKTRRHWNPAAIAVAFLIAAAGCRPESSTPPGHVSFSPTVSARVLYVIDGDTIVLDNGEKVRFLGIDAPEIRKLHDGQYQGVDQPWGPDAARYLSRLLLHKKVGLEFDEERLDKYGRTLAYVVLDDDLINARLLEEGYARFNTFGNELKHQDYLKKAEAKAKARGKGVWEGKAKFLTPRNCVASKTGDVFHDPGCKYAAEIAPENRFRITADEALRLGLKPCGYCSKGLAIQQVTPGS